MPPSLCWPPPPPRSMSIQPIDLVTRRRAGMPLLSAHDWQAARPDLSFSPEVTALLDAYVTARAALDAAEAAIAAAANVPVADLEPIEP